MRVWAISGASNNTVTAKIHQSGENKHQHQHEQKKKKMDPRNQSHQPSSLKSRLNQTDATTEQIRFYSTKLYSTVAVLSQLMRNTAHTSEAPAEASAGAASPAAASAFPASAFSAWCVRVSPCKRTRQSTFWCQALPTSRTTYSSTATQNKRQENMHTTQGYDTRATLHRFVIFFAQNTCANDDRRP